MGRQLKYLPIKPDLSFMHSSGSSSASLCPKVVFYGQDSLATQTNTGSGLPSCLRHAPSSLLVKSTASPKDLRLWAKSEAHLRTLKSWFVGIISTSVSS